MYMHMHHIHMYCICETQVHISVHVNSDLHAASILQKQTFCQRISNGFQVGETVELIGEVGKTNWCRKGTWMSQEFGKWVVNGL